MITKLPIEEFTPTADLTIWDVRDAENYQSGHIEHAKHQSLDSLNKALLDSTTGDIYVLCGGGTKAQKAVEKLHELDPSRNIVHLTGGTRGAIACGMTIIKSNSDE